MKKTKLILTVLASICLPAAIAYKPLFAAAPATPSLPAVPTTTSVPAAESAVAHTSPENSKGASMTDIYSFKEKGLDGSEVDFQKYKGDVILVVNTASECGYTPQYAGLEELSKKYSAKGLKVLGFPCNQFGGQEPGDSAAIHSFCQKNYGVDFQLFEKVDVNGDSANPLFVYLKDAAPNDKGDIKWNFTKFLIDKKGTVVKRYDSKVTPASLSEDLEKLL